MSKFKLNIYSPFSHYLCSEVSFVSVVGEEFVYGILPGHSPMIAKIRISKLKVVTDDREDVYAIGGGVLEVDKDHNLTLLVDSIESKNEIDYERALQAKNRAEKRLNERKEDLDVKRAENALLRALNRINIFKN